MGLLSFDELKLASGYEFASLFRLLEVWILLDDNIKQIPNTLPDDYINKMAKNPVYTISLCIIAEHCENITFKNKVFNMIAQNIGNVLMAGNTTSTSVFGNTSLLAHTSKKARISNI